MDPMTTVGIVQLMNDTFQTKQDNVVVEYPLSIIVNKEKYVTLVASPIYLDELAIGYIYSEGLIKSKQDISLIKIDNGIVEFELNIDIKTLPKNKDRIITSGCGKSIIYTDLDGSDLEKNKLETKIPREYIFNMVNILYQRSELFRETGGVHNALLMAFDGGLSIFREDIGRHNAIDKIIGYMVLNEISPEKTALVTSGRVSAEILVKVARRGIPLLVSRSAPTDLAVKLADELGITLIGFVRGKKFNIYSYAERIT